MAKSSADLTHLRLRVREGLLDQLELASKKNNRTLTGEIIDRLERSFTEEQRIEDMLGGPETAAMLRILAVQIDLLKQDDSTGQERADRAVAATVQALGILAGHMLPQCRWAGVGFGREPTEGRWRVYPTRSASSMMIKLPKSNVQEV